MQELPAHHELSEIVVVASGCSDRTAQLVNEMAACDRRVRLLLQSARMGKADAINAYLRERDSRANVIVLSSTDIVMRPGCLARLLDALRDDPALGMVGARTRPVNPKGSLVGDMVHFLWDLHHERACQVPKLGETVAVRADLMLPLHAECAVDEAWMEAVATQRGYRLGYVPAAVVCNRGPDNLREYFEQRRRIAAGHYWLRRAAGYSVSTLDWMAVAPLALRRLGRLHATAAARCLFGIATEVAARAFGYLDLRRNYSHAVWRIAASAHHAIPQDAATWHDHAEAREYGVGEARAAAD
jgi:cellulose synthase/poly-beta-1,6-N-acetylglucosamine synthase-like glycosyltransferase